MRGNSAWWYVFGISFVAVALLETFLPLRAPTTSTRRRWVANSLLFSISSLTLIGIYDLSGIALAFTLRANSLGLLNRISLPYSLRFAVSFVALDLIGF